MATTRGLISVRECAREIADLYETHADDFDAFVEAATAPTRQLLARPDLMTLGFTLDTHAVKPQLLYCDQQLSIVVAREPYGHPVSVHDHGHWEMLGLYRGSLEHVQYERADDGSIPGHADLREIDRRVLEPGDVVCVPPPPNDVHGFSAQTPDTFLLAIIPGWYKTQRCYFDVERKSYFVLGKPPV